MVIAEFTFKTPVLFFEPDYFYASISICMNEYVSEYTEHVGSMYLIAFNSGQIGLGEFGQYGDRECVKFILSRTSPENIRSIHVPKRSREQALASLRLKVDLTTQPIRTPAVDESIRLVREQITREKKDAPVRK
jgi:hypothetical protein